MAVLDFTQSHPVCRMCLTSSASAPMWLITIFMVHTVKRTSLLLQIGGSRKKEEAMHGEVESLLCTINSTSGLIVDSIHSAMNTLNKPTSVRNKPGYIRTATVVSLWGQKSSIFSLAVIERPGLLGLCVHIQYYVTFILRSCTNVRNKPVNIKVAKWWWNCMEVLRPFQVSVDVTVKLFERPEFAGSVWCTHL